MVNPIKGQCKKSKKELLNLKKTYQNMFNHRFFREKTLKTMQLI